MKTQYTVQRVKPLANIDIRSAEVRRQDDLALWMDRLGYIAIGVVIFGLAAITGLFLVGHHQWPM